MLLSLAINLGILSDVGRGLLAVLVSQSRRKIKLTMLATIDESDNVITVPFIARPNLAT